MTDISALLLHPLPPEKMRGQLLPGAQWGSATSVWVITWPPRNSERVLSRVSIRAPKNLTSNPDVVLFCDTTELSIAPVASVTEYEPYRPIPINAGRYLYLVWFTTVGTAPEATLFTEERMF